MTADSKHPLEMLALHLSFDHLNQTRFFNWFGTDAPGTDLSASAGSADRPAWPAQLPSALSRGLTCAYSHLNNALL